MDDRDKIVGARKGVETMLYYYLSSLIGNVEDPKQVIATELGTLINLSEEQVQYVKMNVANNNKALENLSCCIDLLKSMEQSGELDMTSIKLVKDILEIMHGQCQQATNEYCETITPEE